MATAELAACLPALVVVLAIALSAVSVVGAGVRLQDAAREAARAAARGDTRAAMSLARRAAPGSAVIITASGGQTIARVSEFVHPLGRWLPSFHIDRQAVAATEPSHSVAESPVHDAVPP